MTVTILSSPSPHRQFFTLIPSGSLHPMGLFQYLPEVFTLWHWILLTMPFFSVSSFGFCIIPVSCSLSIFSTVLGRFLFVSSAPHMLLFFKVLPWSSSFLFHSEWWNFDCNISYNSYNFDCNPILLSVICLSIIDSYTYDYHSELVREVSDLCIQLPTGCPEVFQT